MHLYLYLTLVRISEKVKQSDPSFTNDDSYLQQYAENWISNCKILTRHRRLTLTPILSSTFLSSKTTVISNSSFKKVMAPNVPAAYSAAWRALIALECAHIVSLLMTLISGAKRFQSVSQSSG